MNLPDQLRSSILDHTVDLHRYDATVQRKIRAMLDRLGEELVSQLTGAGLDTPRTDWQRARLRALLEETSNTIQKAYEGIGEYQSSAIKGMVEVTGDAIVAACNTAFGADLMIPVKWTPELLETLAGDTLIHGAPSSEWWSRQADGLADAFADQMRQGMLRGETVTQLRDRIMGQNIPGVNAAGKVDLRKVEPALRPPIWTARRNAEALVRTSVLSAANAAHMAAYEANADIMAGVYWCSTLDTRTCLECGRLDSQEWAWGDAHPTAPLHWNCRCITLMRTKTWEELAREAHGNSRLAKELDKMPVGNRASMGGPVSGNLTYEDWFGTLSETRQAEILGPGRFKVFKEQGLSYSDMIGQNGNPLTLKQLAAR